MKQQTSLIILTIIVLICFCACSSSSADSEFEFEQLRWPTYDNAKQIPIPKSTMADVWNCNDVRFEFYLADTTFEDYKAYVDECKAMGFTLDAIEQENRYYALSKAEYELTVEHQTNDVMYVEVVEIRNDVEIKLLHANTDSANMYDIRIEIDGSYEDSSDAGDEAVTFESYLKEGTHTLLIENDDDDDINGRIEFTTQEDTTYLEFTINCLNNKIEIVQGDVSTSSNNSDTETPSDNDKSEMKVEGDAFNFTDKEFIDWINENSTAVVDSTELGVEGISDTNTSYKVTLVDGEVGAVLLNHDDNNNVCAIMFWFDNYALAEALSIYIGDLIDTDFSADEAIDSFVYDKETTYVGGNLTHMKLEIDDDFILAVLAPSEYIVTLLN